MGEKLIKNVGAPCCFRTGIPCCDFALKSIENQCFWRDQKVFLWGARAQPGGVTQQAAALCRLPHARLPPIEATPRLPMEIRMVWLAAARAGCWPLPARGVGRCPRGEFRNSETLRGAETL